MKGVGDLHIYIRFSGQTAVRLSGQTAVRLSGQTAVRLSGQTAVILSCDVLSGQTAVRLSGQTAVKLSGQTAVIFLSGQTAVKLSGQTAAIYTERSNRCAVGNTERSDRPKRKRMFLFLHAYTSRGQPLPSMCATAERKAASRPGIL